MAKRRRELPWRERIFVSPALTAQILTTSQSTVYGLCASGELAAVKAGRRWRISTRAVIEYSARLRGDR